MDDMTNVIWVVLIIIFSIVPVVKAAARKRKAAEKRYASQVEEKPEEDFFYSAAKEEEAVSDWEREWEEAAPKPKAPSRTEVNTRLREEGTASIHSVHPQKQETVEVDEEQEPVIDLTDTDEVRKAVIASEVLNKKYE